MALDFSACAADFLSSCNDFVSNASVIAFGMVVFHGLFNGSAQWLFTEEDKLVETLRFHRSHIPLDVGIQVRAPGRQQNETRINSRCSNP